MSRRSQCAVLKQLTKFVGEVARLRGETDMAAGKLGQSPAEGAGEFDGGLVARQAVRLASGGWKDPVGERGESVQVEVGCRVLAQLVLEPIGGVRADLGVGEVHG